MLARARHRLLLHLRRRATSFLHHIRGELLLLAVIMVVMSLRLLLLLHVVPLLLLDDGAESIHKLHLVVWD